MPNAYVVLQNVVLTTTDANGYYQLQASSDIYDYLYGYTTDLTWEKSGYFFDYDTFHYNVPKFLLVDIRMDFQVYVVPAPTLSAIANVNGTEDTPSTVNLAGIGRGDPDLPMTLAITASSGNTALVPNPTVAYTSPNSTGTLTLNPVANASGSATITVTVTRQDGETAVRTFTYTVSAVNDGPVSSPATSLAFDGVDDRVDVPSLALDNRSFSVELWAKRPELGTWDMAVFQCVPAVNAGLHIGFRPENGFTFAFYGNDLNTPAYTSSAWHHFACTFDATTKARKIYRDGVLVAQDIATANYQGSGAISIGDAYGWGPVPFKGSIADVRIWNVARTAAEISAWRAGVPSNASGLVLNYRFNEGTGTTLINATGDAGQNATLIGTPTRPAPEVNLPNLELVKFTEDTSINLILPAFDIEGAALTYSAVSASTGTVAQVSGSLFTYTPPLNYNGAATMTYTASDGTTPITAKVFLQGTSVEDGPTLAAIPTQTIGEGSPTTSLALSLTDGDPELTQALGLTATSSDTTLIRHPGVLYTSPAETAQITFKPRPGQSGTSTITLVVTNLASGLTVTRTFNIVVTAVDDPPNVGPATALQFNGPIATGNYVRIPGFGTNAPLDEITIEFWQNVNATVAQSTFQMNPDNTVNRILAHVPYSNGQVYWDFGNSSVIEIPFTVNDDQPASALVITPVVLANADLIQTATVPPGGNFRTLNVVPKAGEIGTVHIRLLVQDAGGKTAQAEFDLRIEPKPAFSVFDLGALPGKSASFGTAINDRGAVTGYSTDTADLESNPVAFFFNGIENGGVVEENPPVQVGPSPLSSPFRAWAINNNYAIAGTARNGGQTVPWFKDIENPLSNLGLLVGGSVAEARALNDLGVLTGFGTVTGGKKHAFRFAPGDGALTDLGTAPAWPMPGSSSTRSAVSMQSRKPLSPTLSPPNGEREDLSYDGIC